MGKVTGIWRRFTRGSTTGRLALAGFGKHPVWAEHIQDLGTVSPALAELRRVLYVEGILRLVEEWEQLAPTCRCPFDHWLVLVQSDGIILSRVVASTDRMGRTSFPFILAAELTDCPLACVLRRLPGRMQEFARRVRQFPTPEAVRAAFVSEQGAWESLLTNELESSESALAPTKAERAAFVEHRGFGPDGQGLARLLHKTESAWSGFEGGRGGKAPKLDRDAIPVRVPSAAGHWEASVLLWEDFVAPRVHADVPRLFIVPVNGKWLDLVVGRIEGRCFYGLRANLRAFVPETAVTHVFDTALQQEAVRVLESWRASVSSAALSETAAVPAPSVAPAPAKVEPTIGAPLAPAAGLSAARESAPLPELAPTVELAATAPVLPERLPSPIAHALLARVEPSVYAPQAPSVPTEAQTPVTPPPAEPPAPPEPTSPPAADQPAATIPKPPPPDAKPVAGAPAHEPALIPALSRRTGEADDHGFTATEPLQPVQGPVLEPAGFGGARRPPSHSNRDPDKARQEPRPTGFMATEQVQPEHGTSPEPAAARSEIQAPKPAHQPSPTPPEPLRRSVVGDAALGLPELGRKTRSTRGGRLAVAAVAVLGLALVGWLLVRYGRDVAIGPSTVELQARVRDYIAQGRYAEALEACRTWAGIEPDNVELQRARSSLVAPPVITGSLRMELRAGEEATLALRATDVLRRRLASEVVSAPAGEDRIEHRAEQWVYIAAPGGARSNAFSLVFRHDLAGSTVNVQVAVAPDKAGELLARGDAAFAAKEFAAALASYQQLAQLRSPGAAVSQRIQELLTPPTIILPTGVVVRAGAEVTFALQVTDVLSRKVTVEPASSPAEAAGSLRRLEARPGESWVFTAARNTTNPVGLEFRASNGQTGAVARLMIPVLPGLVEESFRLGEADLAAARFSDALQRFLEVVAQEPNHSAAGARLQVLTNPPPLRLQPGGEVECLLGQTVTGRVELVEVVRLQPPIPWQIEPGNAPTAPNLAFDRRTGTWRWNSSPEHPERVQLGFRAVGPTATSAWQTVTLSTRARRLPLMTGLPTDALELIAGRMSQTSIVFKVTLPEGATNPVRVGCSLEGGPSNLAVSLSASPGSVRTLLLSGLDRPCTNLIHVWAATTDGAVTNSFALLVRVEPQPELQAEPRRDGFPPRQFVWVPFAGGASWDDGTHEPGLWVSRRETSLGEYRLLAKSNPPNLSQGSAGRDELPVTNLSLTNALAYCRVLNAQHAQRLPPKWEFRLPTFAEWMAFSEDGVVPPEAVMGRTQGGPVPVESGQPNRWGIFHAVGNVAEFCMPTADEPRPLTLGRSFTDPQTTRVRGPEVFPRRQDNTVGFRVVLAPSLGSPPR